MSLASVSFPMRLPSVANLREHWATKARRTQSQRHGVTLVLLASNSARDLRDHGAHPGDWSAFDLRFGDRPLLITLTRCAPRTLDDDNLSSAFKAVRDAVAAYLGLDDRDSRLRFVCKQEKAKQASIRIDFDVMEGVA